VLVKDERRWLTQEELAARPSFQSAAHWQSIHADGRWIFLPDGIVEVTRERELFWGPDGVQGEPGVPENTVLVEDEKSLDGGV
jgi:hypothetical protein